jgi:signal transduction histidine kinase
VASMARTWSRRYGIRSRILAIAWIPSLLLLTGGISVSAVLALQGLHTVRFTDRFDADTPGVSAFLSTVMAERRVSVVYLADPRHDRSLLPEMRRQLDATASPMLAAARGRAAMDPDVYLTLVTDVTRAMAQLPTLRQRIDNRTIGLLETSNFYSDLVDSLSSSMYLIANAEPVPGAAVAITGIASLVRAGGAYLQADELALAAAMGHDLSPAEFSRFAQALGGQRSLLDQTRGTLDAAGAARLDQLRASPAGRRLDAAHTTVLLRGPASPDPVPEAGSDRTATGSDRTATGSDRTATGSDRTATGSDRTATGSDRATTGSGAGSGRPGTGTGRPASASLAARSGGLPTPESWNADFQEITGGFAAISVSAAGRATAVSRETGQSQLSRAVLVGALLMVAGIVVLVLTTRESSRLIGRLRRLHEETLLLSRQRLPGIVNRLRRGEQVDVATEVVPLELGSDEIGQVADAFNQAQETAMAAAVGEAEARAGLRTVFLNIAHRSQGIVHRQLSLLDQAERSQEDPEQLSLFFELDHLTTRARRNAENLIILGGGQVGRQWRRSVPLVEVVRGAISEARDYVRVSLGTLPQVSIGGGVVADLVHILAELVDNATSFSPPTARVEVRGNAVGQGLVLEIEDQGLGIEPPQLERLNAMLHQPPDFQAMALNDEPRLGIFVVAQLAARHGIRATLVPSPAYGGTRVVVLIPFHLIEGPSPSLAAVEAAPAAPVPAVAATPAGPRPPSRDPFTAAQPHQASTPGAVPTGPPPTPAPWLASELSAEQVPLATALAADFCAGDPRPVLPRRSRQAHLAAQLRSTDRVGPGTVDGPAADVDPELARRRLSAFQQGTRRAREGEQ